MGNQTKTGRLAAILVAAAAATASAENTITQTFNFDWDSSQPFLMPTFDAFDTMGGTRELTRVSLSTQASMTIDITIENYDAVPYDAGTWTAGVSQSAVLFFQGDDGGGDDDGESAPGFGLGGVFAGGITGDLSAGDGGFPFGTPGDVKVVTSASDSFSTVRDADASSFDFFSSGEPLTALLGTLSDAFVDVPGGGGGGIFINITDTAMSGSISLVYEYALIPAPGGLALLGAGALVASRRRR